jgi:hypothetical protein
MKDYSIIRNNEINYIINPNLIKAKNISEEGLNKIKALHHEKLDVYDLMEAMDPETDKEELFICSQKLTDIEFRLQEAWGFERNAKFHRFWDQPHCTCPKMDNNDTYPYGRYLIHSECYHNFKLTNKKEIKNTSKQDTSKQAIKLLIIVYLYTVLVITGLIYIGVSYV